MKLPLNKQSGATLIEVLIAGLVVAIGLLGVAALQINAMQGSVDAQYRGIASDIAWSLADRMRANVRGFQTGAYDTGGAIACGAAPKACSMVPGGSPIEIADRCTTAEMANADLYEAACSQYGAANLLPNGTISITCGAGGCIAGSRALITVNWQTRTDFDGTGTLTDGLNMQVVPSFDPLYDN